MAPLTVAILEGLLSPDPSLRSASEASFSRLGPDVACHELLRIFQLLLVDGGGGPGGGGPGGGRRCREEDALRQLICVLLRREVLKITSLDTLVQLVDPLLGMFFASSSSCRRAEDEDEAAALGRGAGGRGRNNDPNASSSSLSLIGGCLASALQGLEQLGGGDAQSWGGGGRGGGGGSIGAGAAVDAVYPRVLSAVATPASQGQVDCLALLTELARTSPRTYCRTAMPSLPNLVKSVLTHLSSQDRSGGTEEYYDEGVATALPALALLVVQTAISAEAGAVIVASDHRGEPPLGGPSHSIPAWLVTAMPPSGGRDPSTVDPDSTTVAQLGESCWGPIVQRASSILFTAAAAAAAPSSSSSTSFASRMLEPFLLAAESAPALMLRAPVLHASLTFLNGAMNTIAAASSATHSGVGDAAAAAAAAAVLPVVNVVATLIDGRPDVRRRVAALEAPGIGGGGGSSSATSNVLLESCIVSCLRTMATCGSCTVVVDSGLDVGEDDIALDGIGDDDDDDDDVIDNSMYAESLLETLSRSLGAPAVQLVLSNISAHRQQQPPRVASPSPSLSSSRWCLAALRCCAMAAPTSLSPHARVAMEWALTTTTAALPLRSVGTSERCEAIVLIATLTEQYPELRREYAARVLGCFHSTLADALLMSNAAQAIPPAELSATCHFTCRALVSFCRGPGNGTPHELVDSPLVLPHLPALLPTMVRLLQQPATRIAVRSSLVSALACLATLAGPEFRMYYSSVMPVLLQHIANPWQASHVSHSSFAISELRGSALESATIIGQAVDDTELFGADAIQLLQFAIQQLEVLQQTGDCCLPAESVLSACARIASAIKDAYAPYADLVVTHMLKRATDPSDVEVSEVPESKLGAVMQGQVELSEDGGSESMTVAIPGRGLTQVTIHTTAIQGKVQAIRALYEHAAALGPLFSPWCERSFDELIGMVTFAYSADVRGSVCQTLSAVFQSACLFGADIGSMGIPARYLSTLLLSMSKQLLSEETTLDIETLHAQAEALSDILFNAYRQLEVYRDQILSQYNVHDAVPVVQNCIACLISCLGRRRKIASARFGANGTQPTDVEVREYEQQLQVEDALLTPLVDSIGYNLKFFRHDFERAFDSIVAPVLSPYLSDGTDVPARLAAMCLFDDCIEHCGANAADKFAPILAAGAVDVLDDTATNHDLLAASIYGIAQICRYTRTSALYSYEDRVMRGLRAILLGVKNEENVAVYENTVSAIASLLLFGSAPFSSSRIISRDEFLPLFLRNMPLQIDYDESKICSAGLCDLVEKSFIPLNASTIMELLRIIGDSLALVEEGEDVATPETCMRFAAILFQMQRETPREILQQRFSALSPEAQAAVHKAMGQYASQLGAVVTP